MIEAVIFDSDGVLVNTDQYHYLSWKAIADKEGIYFDSEINNQMRGISREDSLNVLLKRADKEYTLPEKEALLVKKNDLYQAYLAQLTPASAEADVASTFELAEEERHQVSRGFVVKINSSRLRESGPS
jgi:beta-phosphoglucomutase-like phosphatase (HAD superfamily)